MIRISSLVLLGFVFALLTMIARASAGWEPRWAPASDIRLTIACGFVDQETETELVRVETTPRCFAPAPAPDSVWCGFAIDELRWDFHGPR